MDKRRYELKRVGVFSAVKTCFVLGGATGFLTGLMMWAFLGMAIWMGQRSPFPAGLGGQYQMENILGNVIGAIGFVFPLAGAFTGAIGGVVLGFVLSLFYNLSARFWGGLELDWETVAPPVRMTPPTPVLVSSTPSPLPEGGTPLPVAQQSARSHQPSVQTGNAAENDHPGTGQLYE